MGWWMNIEVDLGGKEPHSLTDWNYTHNTTAMLRLAFDDDDDLGVLDGLTGIEARPFLVLAIGFLQDDANRAQLDALEPANGWGSRAGITGVLESMLHWCGETPRARFSGPRR